MELLKDMHRFGPAPTWEREMAATAANLVFLLLALGFCLLVLQAPFSAAIVAVVGVVLLGGRLVVALRNRSEGSR